ncbi:hypothetical protein [Bizionia sp.]|uniref:hypothetical protein n=1 Tax=Bizionia sp. TaxID=1954480 RepID=UPI003A8F8A13
MAYNLYTTEKVFANESLNIICNQIMQALEEKFTGGTLDDKFGVTGTVAKIIQGDSLEPVKCIAFATSDVDVFTLCRTDVLKAIKHKGTVFYNDKIEITTEKLNIEVWLRNTGITLIETNGIYGEDKTEIPAYIL